MGKRTLSMILIAMVCMALFPVLTFAAASVSAAYDAGKVTVTGTGFTSGVSYTIRVVDAANSSVKAMGQATADGSGNISASVTTGSLGALSDYIVYVNRPDGGLAASDTSIEGAAAPPPPPAPPSASGSTPTPLPAVSVTANGNSIAVSVAVKTVKDPATGRNKAVIQGETAIALAEKAKEAENAGQKATVEIKAEAAENTGAVEVEIPRGAFRQLADTTNADLRVDTGIGSIIFDAKAVDSINAQAAEGDVSIVVQKVETAALTEEVRTEVGDRPVYDFSVTAGGAGITDFGGGKAEISIPYAPKAGEDADSVVVYYIDNTGRLITVRGGYNAVTGTVIFTVTHFSKYMIGYNKVSFSDVREKDWYGKAIGFIAARGIAGGVGGDRFAPGDSVTRADFLVMVMKAYGIEPDANIADNFSDAGNEYYTRYLGTAKRLGLVSGVGNNKYAPKAAISRQDMFATLYRILEKLDELPSGTGGKSLESFKDAGDIAGYAKEAMKRFVETGTVTGDRENLTPKNTSTRAQTAQILYNLLSK